MTHLRLLEATLVVAVAAIWLGPLLLGIRRRALSLLHPSAVFPLWVVLSTSVTMTARWIGFHAGLSMPGLRISTRRLADSPYFVLVPLVLVAVAGIAYHWGVYVGCRRIVPTATDRVHLDPTLTTVGYPFGRLIHIPLWLLAVLLPIPFLVFGQGSGFFWATALVYALGYLPVAAVKQKPVAGWSLLAVCIVLIGLRGSKGDFIYAVLPILLFTQGNFGMGGRIRLARIVALTSLLTVTVVGTRYAVRRRGVDLEEGGLAMHVLRREYGFEVFALLVDRDDPDRVERDGSWLLDELKETLPSGLGLPKRRPGTLVSREYLPYDYTVLPEAGFSRFFLFPFFHDFGYLGVVLGGFVLGLGLAWPYERLRQEVSRRRELWPLILYLPLPVYGELLVNGAFSYAAVHVAMAVSPLALAIAFVRSRRLWGDPIVGESAA